MVNSIKQKIHNLIYDERFSEILTGSVWALSGRIIATAVGLISSIIVARFYGVEIVGIVAVINTFLILVTIFTIFGTSTSILRLIPEHLAKYSFTSAFKVYRKTQYMVIGTSVITASIFFFGANLIADKVFSKPHLSYYFALASVFVVFKSIMELNIQAVRGLRLIKIFTLMQVLPQTCNLLFLIAVGLFWSASDVPVYAVLFGFALTGTIGWIIMEYAFKKRMQSCDTVHSISKRTIISISLPMLMTATMGFLMSQTGILMLGIFRTEAEVGYYAISVKLASLTTFVFAAINSMAAPRFSELFHSGEIEELFYIAKKSAKLIFFTTSPILAGLIFLGRPVISIVFGADFLVSYQPLLILIFGQFVNTISGASGYFMNMTDNHKMYRNIMIITAGINILLNYSFIPKYGISGAAIATMASVCFCNISTLTYIKIKYGKTTGYLPF